jgi:hypothetical protein
MYYVTEGAFMARSKDTREFTDSAVRLVNVLVYPAQKWRVERSTLLQARRI